MIAGFSILLCAGLGGYYYHRATTHGIWIDTSCLKDYPLTRKTLDCALQDESTARMHNIDTIIDKETARYIQQGKAKRISVWTRDLETNQWASTNELDQYAPASMMKVPIMIAYLKLAEYNPSVLDQRITYAVQEHNGDSEDFTPSTTMVVGKQYTAQELINDMIVNSDNNALYALASKLDPYILADTLIKIGIKIPTNAKVYDFLTAKSYANIFRILHNVSYLDRVDSQIALQLLSQTSFNEGIRRPIPSNVVVSHKFGERKVLNSDGSLGEIELHDCGIVYKSPDPYSICIMTSGTDFNDLQTILSDISQIVYDNM